MLQRLFQKRLWTFPKEIMLQSLFQKRLYYKDFSKRDYIMFQKRFLKRLFCKDYVTQTFHEEIMLQRLFLKSPEQKARTIFPGAVTVSLKQRRFSPQCDTFMATVCLLHFPDQQFICYDVLSVCRLHEKPVNDFHELLRSAD